MAKRMKSRCIPLLASLILAGVCAHADLAAMPAHPEVVDAMRRRGDREGLRRIGARAAGEARRGINHISQPVSAQGDFRLLVLMIQYTDRPFAPGSTAQFYSDLLNGATTSALSMKKYYADMSGGSFRITIDVEGPYTASNTWSHYGANTLTNSSSMSDRAPAALVREAVVAAYNGGSGVNFAPYDNDNNGRVDMVMVVHAGAGEEVSQNPDDIWSHAWELSAAGGAVNVGGGRTANVYCIQPEFVRSAGDSTIGVFCHEFGHVLGLADMYDTSYETDGAGIHTIMARGSWAGIDGSHPTPFLAWEKAMLGWITCKSPSGETVFPQVFSRSTQLSLGAPREALADRGPAPVPYLAFAFGLLASGWYTRRGGRAAALASVLALLLAAALLGVNCGESDPGGSSFSDAGSSSPGADSSSSDAGSSSSGAGSSSSSGGASSAPPVSLGDIEATREAIVVPLVNSPADQRQYYFLENKVRVNGTWTQYLPGDGLLITHIHDGVIAAKINANAVNDGADRIHGVNIVEADNNNELWSPKGDYGQQTDLFSGRNFTPSTSPGTRYYTGASPGWLKAGTAASRAYFLNISAPGPVMTFRYEVR